MVTLILVVSLVVFAAVEDNSDGENDDTPDAGNIMEEKQ